jgi:hypothetical protein
MNGYWQSFIPSTPVGPVAERAATIFTSMMLEPHPKSRVAAIGVLADLLDGSKQFLAAASEAPETTSGFTTFSSTLGAMIREIHDGLARCLSMEASTHVLSHGLKCLSLLVVNTPYPRLLPGHLSRLVDVVGPLIGHVDDTVAAAALGCAGCLLGVREPNASDSKRLLPTSGGGSSASGRNRPQEEATAGRGDGDRTLVRIVLSVASAASAKTLGRGPSVQAEALGALAQLCQAHPVADSIFWKDLVEIATDAAWAEDGTIRSAATKLLGFLGKSLYERTTAAAAATPAAAAAVAATSDEGAGVAVATDSSARSLVTSSLVTATSSAAGFWTALTSTDGTSEPLLQTLLQDAVADIRSSACDCVSSIDTGSLSCLPARIVCQTLVLGLMQDPVTTVKASASRAVGMLVMFPELRSDMSFVMDVATCLLDVLQEKALPTRIRASWAFGNLADALVARHEVTPDAHVPSKLLVNVLNAALKSAKDNDKVRSNAMRSLGGLGRIVDADFLALPDGPSMVSSIGEALVANLETGAVKVRWNAAHGLGMMLRNECLPTESDWTKSILSALIRVAREAPNFKVRINAVQALAMPPSRTFYGPSASFRLMIGTLVECLATIDTMDHFSEFKYQQSLREQLFATLLRLLLLATQSELSSIVTALHATFVTPTTIDSDGDAELAMASGSILQQVLHLLPAGVYTKLLASSERESELPGQYTWLVTYRAGPKGPVPHDGDQIIGTAGSAGAMPLL